MLPNLTLVIQGLAFFAVAWLVMKFGWPHIIAAIEERQQKIAEGLAAADSAQKNLAQAEEKVAEELKHARAKANEIIEQAHQRANQIVDAAKNEAIVEASRTRLRPILMTTCAILAGLVPTALGIGIGGQQRAAIAVTIIGGQSLCLFLTLLLVPVAYVKFDALEQSAFGQRFSGAAQRLKESVSARVRFRST